MYKIAFIDLDGTLLTKGKSIAKFDLEQLKKFAQNNGLIILSSGRWHNSVISFAKKINEFKPGCTPYVASYNGAALYDFKKEKFLINNSISNEMLKKAVEISDKFKIVALIYGNDGKSIYLHRFPMKFLFDRYLNGKTLKAKKNLDNKNEISKIIFISFSSKKMAAAYEYLQSQFKDMYNVCYTNKMAIEVNCLKSNKGMVVDSVLDLAGLKKDDAIAFGDSFNDLSMFKKVFFSVGFKIKKNELLNFTSVNFKNNSLFGSAFKKYAFGFNIDKKNFWVDCSLINKENIEEFKKLINYAKNDKNKKIILIGNRDFKEINLINGELGTIADYIVHNGTFIDNVVNYKFPVYHMLKDNELIIYYTNSNKIFYQTKMKNFDIEDFIKNVLFDPNKICEKIDLNNLNSKIVSGEKFYFCKTQNKWKLNYFDNVKNSIKNKIYIRNFFLKNEITPDDSTGFFTQMIDFQFPSEIYNLSSNFCEQLAHLFKKIK